ncbi:sialidase family protein [Paludibaculum fermentans]|uniref:Exo-alpha-sialidase n=1 Tax=Paludibaculum fermentans TaxID=1473598 RepID=A0A7S7NTE6_PALFE|nr:sialidase family protein [Paludibaculum fermentans]QOY89389.1 exo-alpha-sialidase [Paludibaculum fermentans]
MYRTLSCIASSVLCCAALLADPPAAPRTAEGFPDLALVPPPLNTRPGPEYGNDMRKFQGIPTIERASNGRLWAAWYGGGSGEDPFNYLVLVTSGDDGATWSKPVLVVDPPGFVHTWEPSLWHDPSGRLWFFWSQSFGRWDGRGGVWAITADDSRSATTGWSQPRRIADGDMLNKPTALSTGEWLLPVAFWPMPADHATVNAKYNLGWTPTLMRYMTHDFGADRGASVVIVSRDKGRSFERLGHAVVPDVGHNEPMIVERNDKSLWMLIRTTYGIGESISTDRGRTWSEGRASGIPHVVARFHIRRLASGALLLVRHNPQEFGKVIGKGRSHLSAFLSQDDGKTWSGGLLLDERENVSYPDSTEGPGGRLYIIYDRERTGAREILMAQVTEKEVAAGKLAEGSGSRLTVLINKAVD